MGGRAVASPRDGLAPALAALAEGLAAGAGTTLPDGLRLWELAGGRPVVAPRVDSGDPGAALGRALEAGLDAGARRLGAHHTPAPLADAVASDAIDRPAEVATVCDPACGGGALLLAAGRRMVAAGRNPGDIARSALWGADLDPLAAAVTEAAVALWSGGTAPGRGHVVAADTLVGGIGAWPAAPASGFGAVVGNPPFQGQLAAATARGAVERSRLRARFGEAASGPYVDTAALFVLAAIDAVAPGGRVALVLPRSVLASRDAGPVRDAAAGRARLVGLRPLPPGSFAAAVQTCVVTLEAGTRGSPEWAAELAALEGVPTVELDDARCLGELATAIVGFRDEYYGLVPHVAEERAPHAAVPRPGTARLVTSGAVDLGRSTWGERPIRFAKQRWHRPVVDLAALEAAGGRPWAFARRVLAPKVVVATQTRVLEAVADEAGSWLPSTPAVSVVPRVGAPSLTALSAAICAPPVSAWAAARASGTAMAAGAIRVGAGLVEALPLPVDERAWASATEALRRWVDDGADADAVERWAGPATAAHGIGRRQAEQVLAWWTARLPSRP